jgi:hypothetical protein
MEAGARGRPATTPAPAPGGSPTSSPAAGGSPTSSPSRDQATTTTFRALLLVEVAAAAFFGLFPFAFPETFASVFGLPGAEPFVYRIAGAATTGYGVMAAFAFLRPRWATFRIPLIATLTFNVGAVIAALLSADAGDLSPLVGIVGLAASAFSLASAYWLYRDEGPRIETGEQVEEGFRATLLAATAVAGLFGILPLLLANTFVTDFGLPDSDLFIYRLAGAATLGYGAAGVFQLLSGRWPEIRLQVLGAITFNALGALAAAIYLAAGGRSFLGLLILVAAGFFTLALTWWSARAAT